MTLAEFFGLLRADPAILIPGGVRSPQRMPMQALSFGHAQAIRRHDPEAEPDAKRSVRKLVRSVIAFRKAGKRK